MADRTTTIKAYCEYQRQLTALAAFGVDAGNCSDRVGKAFDNGKCSAAADDSAVYGCLIPELNKLRTSSAEGGVTPGAKKYGTVQACLAANTDKNAEQCAEIVEREGKEAPAKKYGTVKECLADNTDKNAEQCAEIVEKGGGAAPVKRYNTVKEYLVDNPTKTVKEAAEYIAAQDSDGDKNVALHLTLGAGWTPDMGGMKGAPDFTSVGAIPILVGIGVGSKKNSGFFWDLSLIGRFQITLPNEEGGVVTRDMDLSGGIDVQALLGGMGEVNGVGIGGGALLGVGWQGGFIDDGSEGGERKNAFAIPLGVFFMVAPLPWLKVALTYDYRFIIRTGEVQYPGMHEFGARLIFVPQKK